MNIPLNRLIRTSGGFQPFLEFTLYSFPPSTCSWRVRAALYHHLPMLSRYVRIGTDHQEENKMKNNVDSNNYCLELYQKFTSHHLIPIDLFAKENEESSYLKINPMKQVPALVVKALDREKVEEKDGIVLTQSLPIVEFLDHLVQVIRSNDQKHSSGSINNKETSQYPLRTYLIPKSDLFIEFKTRQLSEIINAGIQPMQNVQLLRMLPKELRGEQNKKWIGEWHRKGLRQVELILKEQYESMERMDELVHSGKTLYSIRECAHLTMADLCLVPSVEASIQRSDIHMEEEFPFSFAVYNSLKNLDVFTHTRN
ncbi:hypothetical protein C9374_002861 [Naegleria lovaniensis]|uniref:GST N-terminal domain-containing protein n=1 Tax=Naegleria lovaniensis TaxID=51637 RepID=A0AA88GT64_NAELO|nr:uncharacterized protein C9374_002861 [Naegleria lovaniensis]KAG2386415.1 hypothetical protein C9374_002861 [Naegleria lovaniensis]